MLPDPDYDFKCLPTAYIDLTEPPPAAVAESPPPRGGGEGCWFVDKLGLDHVSPVELRSCDSTFIDSPDASHGGTNAPDSGLFSGDTDQDRIAWHDQETDHPFEAGNKIHIHLRVKPPRTTIALCCSAPRSKQQGARHPRRTKSAHRRRIASYGGRLVEDRNFVKLEHAAFHEYWFALLIP